MFNIENYGITTGGLTTDPQIYENSDGSCKIRITVAAANNYIPQIFLIVVVKTSIMLSSRTLI